MGESKSREIELGKFPGRGRGGGRQEKAHSADGKEQSELKLYGPEQDSNRLSPGRIDFDVDNF